ncbi:MAG: SIMPL domain-containing protein, partial [Marinomonas sp.]
APDIANFDVSVVSTGSTASQALQNNSRQMQNVFAALRRLGIAQKDIQTSSVSLQPQFQRFNRNGPQESQTPRITGYNASNSVRIIQRDLDNLGRTIDALVTAGANRVNGPTFGLANSDAERNRARVDAIKDARARAELYAGAAGLRVKRIMLISDQSPGIVRPQMRFARMEAADSSVPISPGEQAITASVSVMFELSPR